MGNARATMRESNRRTREFLFNEGWSTMWFKSHEDMRKKSAGDWYYNSDNKAHRCLDPFNLFDACGYDAQGRMWWIQIKSGQWPEEQPLLTFSIEKFINILCVNVKKPTKKRKTYKIELREYRNGVLLENA